MTEPVHFERLSAVTLATADMARSVAFYLGIGFQLRSGGPESTFTTYVVADAWLNVQSVEGAVGERFGGRWGRVIIWVDDVDAMYRRCLAAGADVVQAPADASWGERYFHVRDPDGHELSFAHPLAGD